MHGSEPNLSDKPRRGMKMCSMPSTSVYNRERCLDDPKSMPHMAQLPLFLMRGTDRSGKNFAI